MKILYVGQLDEGGTCLDRMRALRRIGHEVTGFNVSCLRSRHRLLRSAQSRWNPRLLLGDLNRQVFAAAMAAGQLDCVWVDKGVWIFPETLGEAKRRRGCSLIHYTPDSQILINRSPHFLESIPLYDYLITTKQFEVDHYQILGARVIKCLPQSYCPIKYANPEPKTDYGHDLGFIGDFKPSYGRVIRALYRHIPDIGVWGPRWPRAAWMRRAPVEVVKGDGLWGPDYVNALASFKIGLGLLSKYIPEQHTTRSFEIPAARTFLLAERTEEHQAFFKEGEEAEFFDSSDELLSKARFYLSHEATRQQMAARGRERCCRSGYDTDSVLRRILKELT